ncbi:superfamily II DNA or RNA helicase [Methanocalculus alkaliphilus]|uniref:DEAD/DEAH box helicase family protein n=1 Tax=Methanocalculus alkaliphilus TaxID=768730 RepID=UPI00209EE8B6|nr:DEAD/DEAH box helicase family protein [Methanocalculus alkaliphilus]MCP1715512.1 superfamily II DNA or RNA helicase [Methanocalculus alkaliphilus]
MSFRDLNLKNSYTSEKDNILHGFYIPILKEAIYYKRITGYFSSSSFLIAASGLSHFIKNDGKMKFILNIVLSELDYAQIEKGIQTPEKIIEERLIEDLDLFEDKCKNDYTKVLGWLIAKGYLEVKIGYIKEKNKAYEILHQKVGILEDNEGNIITFSGSNNESAYGWAYNSEKFKVFFNWIENQESYIVEDIQDFEDLWNNKSNRTNVISFPEAIKQKVISLVNRDPLDIEEILSKINYAQNPSSLLVCEKPTKIHLRGYQNEAIGKWFDNGCQGIFEMATGTGKTFTAIGALEKLLERESNLIAIISAPYLHLVNQWEKALLEMSLKVPIIHVSSINPKWKEELTEKILNNRLGRDNQLIILITHDSLSSDLFIEKMKDVGPTTSILLIGDEVHGLGSITRLAGLLSIYNYRLGLSATPKRHFDELGTEGLLDYFGGVIYTFDLHRAINEINPDTGETFLAPYEYHPIIVELTKTEMDKYSSLSGKIAILLNKKNKTTKDQLGLEKKLRERQDILKNSSTKYPAFEMIIDELIRNNFIKHTLIYCSPQQINAVQELLRTEGDIVQHRFTSKENAIRKQKRYGDLTEREYLLNNFSRGNYHVLVAIRCLDEGVDVPATRNAILMCSSGNPKEYIQRRGRVLRRFPGKSKAIIYDITAIPTTLDGHQHKIDKKNLELQLNRLEEFSQDAINREDVERIIFDIRKRYSAYGG